MKIAIMQPYFFPYINYFRLINKVDTFVIFDDVNYIKRGWINRNYILVNNKPHLITLNLNKASQNKKISELSINANTDKIIKTIYYSYKKAPNFYNFFPILEKIFNFKNMNLSKWLFNSIFEISKYLKLETNFIFSSKIDKDNTLKGEEKIILICKILKSNHYINPVGGKKIYNELNFKNNGINLEFLKNITPKYRQFCNLFYPNLSIIDYLMFNSNNNIPLDK